MCARELLLVTGQWLRVAGVMAGLVVGGASTLGQTAVSGHSAVSARAVGGACDCAAVAGL